MITEFVNTKKMTAMINTEGMIDCLTFIEFILTIELYAMYQPLYKTYKNNMNKVKKLDNDLSVINTVSANNGSD